MALARVSAVRNAWASKLVFGVASFCFALYSGYFTYGQARTSPLPVRFSDFVLGVGFPLLIGAVAVFKAGVRYEASKVARKFEVPSAARRL